MKKTIKKCSGPTDFTFTDDHHPAPTFTPPELPKRAQNQGISYNYNPQVTRVFILHLQYNLRVHSRFILQFFLIYGHIIEINKKYIEMVSTSQCSFKFKQNSSSFIILILYIVSLILYFCICGLLYN